MRGCAASSKITQPTCGLGEVTPERAAAAMAFRAAKRRPETGKSGVIVTANLPEKSFHRFRGSRHSYGARMRAAARHSYHPDFDRRCWNFTNSTDYWLQSGCGL